MNSIKPDEGLCSLIKKDYLKSWFGHVSLVAVWQC